MSRPMVAVSLLLLLLALCAHAMPTDPPSGAPTGTASPSAAPTRVPTATPTSAPTAAPTAASPYAVLLAHYTFEGNSTANTAPDWTGTAGTPLACCGVTPAARRGAPSQWAGAITDGAQGINTDLSKESGQGALVNVTGQTIAFWANWIYGADDCVLIYADDTGNPQPRVYGNGSMLVTFDNGGGTSMLASAVQNGTWVHVARVIEDWAYTRVYVNGTQRFESILAPGSHMVTWATTLAFGCADTTQLDDVRVYGFAATADQVAALYAGDEITFGTWAPSAAPTVAPTAQGQVGVEVTANSSAAVGVTVGNHTADVAAGGGDGHGASDTAMVVALVNATGSDTVTIVPYAGAAAFEAAIAAGGCADAATPLGMLGAVVRRFTLTTSVSVRAAFSIAHDTRVNGYKPSRHLRLCYNNTWMRADDVCAALWTDDNVGAARAAEARVTTVVRAGVADGAPVTTLVQWLCHATPFAIVDPSTGRYICDKGFYGCDCAWTDWWLSRTSYMALVIVGTLVAALAQAWWHWSDIRRTGDAKRTEDGIDETSDEQALLAWPASEQQRGRADTASSCARWLCCCLRAQFWLACARLLHRVTVQMACGLAVLMYAVEWERPAGVDPASESGYTGRLTMMGWFAVALAVALPLLPWVSCCGYACRQRTRSAVGTRSTAAPLALVRFVWSLVIWPYAYEISHRVGSGIAYTYIVWTLVMAFQQATRAPSTWGEQPRWMRAGFALVDVLAFATITAFVFLVTPCQDVHDA